MVSFADIEMCTHAVGTAEDDDVAAERAAVEALVKEGNTANEALVALNLKKNFRALQVTFLLLYFHSNIDVCWRNSCLFDGKLTLCRLYVHHQR